MNRRQVRPAARPPLGGWPVAVSWCRHGWIRGACLVALAVLLQACERTDSVQRGQRGTAMLQLYEPANLARHEQANLIPEPEPVDEPDPEGPSIAEVFQNVQVVNDLTVLEFSRLMQAMATWIAPEEGCEFCHNPENLASDEKYTKVVARRMLQMTRMLNTDWKPHVGQVGVTCWTCHRGQAVPSGDWFKHPGESHARQTFSGNKRGQNTAGVQDVGNAALPYDPLSTYLNTAAPEIRVQSTQALPAGMGSGPSVRQAEATYSLMIYMSQSLGVNCTYCHNTRALANWTESTPQRATAWHGIRMVRKLNVDYLNPIAALLPAHRLSAGGDGPKVGCQTCHKGVFKPLLGVTMLNDYPELRGPLREPVPPKPPEEAASSVGLPQLPTAHIADGDRPSLR